MEVGWNSLHFMKPMRIIKNPRPYSSLHLKAWCTHCVCVRMTLVRMRALRVCSTAPPIKATAPTHMKWAGAVAGWTGLEPATFCVTGRRSNQLSYHPVDWERARTLGSTKGESSAVFPLSAKSRRRIPPVAFAVVAQPDRATVF